MIIPLSLIFLASIVTGHVSLFVFIVVAYVAAGWAFVKYEEHHEEDTMPFWLRAVVVVYGPLIYLLWVSLGFIVKCFFTPRTATVETTR